jgi:TRAP-type C4-dicarboxylate transport system permease small subunit
VVLVLALAVDLPASRSTGEIGRDFLGARAEARIGLWLEIIGGVLAVAAGALALWGKKRRGT